VRSLWTYTVRSFWALNCLWEAFGNLPFCGMLRYAPIHQIMMREHNAAMNKYSRN
jgi:hypothetical protein